MSDNIPIILRPEPEGGFTILVPSIPGCVSFGETKEETKRMAEDAIRGYVDVLIHL